MQIKSNTKTYNVNICDDFNTVKDLVIDENTFIVLDKKLYGLYKNQLFNNIPEEKMYLIEATEENKVIETALNLCEVMTKISAKKNLKFISLGGGIIQDVTGFTANVLYRGVHWTFFPTTLLAACDSCIGGKTSLNYKRYKNLLGTFYPPDEINICTPFFQTLSERDFMSGLGEVVKFNVMEGKTGIDRIEKGMDSLLSRNDKVLVDCVNRSLSFKKPFIEEDEFDRGERIKLNFAHTFGHAYETISNYAIPHGTAVAMGTITANRISLNRGWMDEKTVNRIEKVLLRIIHIDKQNIDFDIDKIIAAIHKDKKQTSENITAVLIQGENMDLKIVTDVSVDEIRVGVQSLLYSIQ